MMKRYHARWLGLRTVWILAALAGASAGYAQQESARETNIAAGQEPPRLDTVFSDDFRRDSRSDYERIRGEVSWEPGSLTLAEATTIRRAMVGGAWAKVELDVTLPDLTAEVPNSELEVWLALRGTNSCIVRIRRSVQNGEPQLTAGVFDTRQKDGRAFADVVRETQHTSADFRQLTIEYRYGLVRVSIDGEQTTLGYVAKGNAPVAAIYLAAPRSSFQLRRVSMMGDPAQRALTVEQQQRLAEATVATRKMNALYNEGKFADAAKIGDELCAVQRAILGVQHPDYSQSLNNLAVLYQSMGEYTRAESLFLEANAIYERILGKEHPNYAASLNNLAVLYYSMGEHRRAELLYTEVIAIREKLLGKEHPDYATSLNNLAALYVSMGAYQRAEPMYLEAKAITENVLGKENPDYATSLNNLAALYYLMAEYQRAESMYMEAMAIRERVLGKEHPNYAECLNNLAALYDARGKYADAELLYAKAKAIREKVLGTEHPDYASSLNMLAEFYNSMGEYARAEPLFVEAKAIREKVLGKNHPDYATSLSNLAKLYKSIGDYAPAEPLYVEARAIRERTQGKQHPDFAISLINLAELYNSMGDYARAEQLYVEAQATIENVMGKESKVYSRCLHSLASLYLTMGNYTHAEPLFVKAHVIVEKLNGKEHPHYATSLNGLAAFYFSIGDYPHAEAVSVEAKAICERSLGKTHPIYVASVTNLALLYMLMGDYPRAEPLLKESQRALLTASRSMLPSLSEAQAASWLAINRPSADLVLSNLRRQERWDSPVPYAAVWQSKSLGRRVRVTHTLPAGASPAAREVFAKLRDARLKLAKLVCATPTPDQTAVYRTAFVDANDRKEGLEKKLADVNPATQRAIEVRDATIDDLLTHLPADAAVVDLVLLDDWNKLIGLAKQNGKREPRTVKTRNSAPVYDAFVLRSNRPEHSKAAVWVPLGDAEPIDTAVASWRRQLTGEADNRGLGNKSKLVSGQALATNVDPRVVLRRLIWDKLEPHLHGCHTVILLPDGALHRLPWAALPGRKPHSFLIEDYALGTASYGQQLFGLLSDEPPADAGGLLLAGGIQYDRRPDSKAETTEPGSPESPEPATQLAVRSRSVELSDEDRSWSFLKGAEREAATVKTLWGTRGPTLYLNGTRGDEKAVAAGLSQSRYAHLATHGFFDKHADVYHVNLRDQQLFESAIVGHSRGATVAARNPLLMTGIVLAGANLEPVKDDLGIPTGEDGILTAEEIISLDLHNTELVTLSACETGLGDVAVGEGVFGLQRALHQAGVRTVIASLWKVSDPATEMLMTEFYRNLWDKKLSKLEALRQAQLTMLARYDATTGKLRGLGKQSEPVNPSSDQPASNVGPLSPKYWAAFQLSGDWR